MIDHVWDIFLHHRSSRELHVVVVLQACSKAMRKEISKLCEGQIVISEDSILACNIPTRENRQAFLQSLHMWCINNSRLLRTLDMRSKKSQQEQQQQKKQPEPSSDCFTAIASQIRPAVAAITLAAAAHGGLLLQELHTDTQLSSSNLQHLSAATLTSLSFNYTRSVEACWDDSVKQDQLAAVTAALVQLTGLRELDLRGDHFSTSVLPCLTALRQLTVLRVESSHQLDELGLEQQQQRQQQQQLLQLLVGR